MIYLVPENAAVPPYGDGEDWRITVRCSDCPGYGVSFQGKSLEFELMGIPENAVPVGQVMVEANNHIRMSHYALPANVN